MPYTRRYPGGFVDLPSTTTLVDSTFLNAVESALLALYPSAPGVGQVGVWDGAKFAPKQITNAEIDPAAAIAKSKLAALSLVDADVAAGAAVALSKLASAGQIGASGVTIGANSITLGGDTTLSRAAAGQLQTGGFFLATSDVLGRYGVATQMRLGGILGNTVPGLTFGSAEDTNLYRWAAGILRTDGDFWVNNTLRMTGTAPQIYAPGFTGAGNFIATSHVGDAASRWLVEDSGKMWWGSGAGAADVTLARTGAGQLTVAGMLVTQKFSPTQINANLTASVNDWAPTGLATVGSIAISGSAAWNITGIDGTQSGQWLALLSISAFNITLKNQDAGSLAANRFACPGAVDFVLAPGHAVLLVYDNTNFRWRIIGS